MLRCEILDVQGFDPAIHGMRNPKNSWDKSDSYDAVDCGKCGLIEEKGVCNKEDRLGRCDNFRCYAVGDNDLKLMKTLFNAGTEHLSKTNLIILNMTIDAINNARQDFIMNNDKVDWWQMIQLLPTSFNQKRTVMMNYEVVARIIEQRSHHKLDE